MDVTEPLLISTRVVADLTANKTILTYSSYSVDCQRGVSPLCLPKHCENELKNQNLQ